MATSEDIDQTRAKCVAKHENINTVAGYKEPASLDIPQFTYKSIINKKFDYQNFIIILLIYSNC
jgi:hypothetical protein